MARTHGGILTPIPSGTSTRVYGQTMVGNYVTIALVSQIDTPLSTTQTVCRFPFRQPFRASSVSIDSWGANINAWDLRHADATSLIVTSGFASVGSTPRRINTTTLQQTRRNFAMGDSLDLIIQTTAGGTNPAGQFMAWVTGYFTDHVTIASPFAESGQSKKSGPVAGYYDLLYFQGTDIVQAGGTNGTGRLTLPYNCRAEAICYDLRGHTETTGTILGSVDYFDPLQAAFVDFTQLLDIDVNEQILVDRDSAPPMDGIAPNSPIGLLQDGQVRISIGQTGAADIVPIAAFSAYLLVWVTGHVRNSATEATVED